MGFFNKQSGEGGSGIIFLFNNGIWFFMVLDEDEA